MKSVALIPRATLLPVGVYLFITWYFVEKPVRMVSNAWRYAVALSEIFSFTFLMRTFFKPWKNICDEYPDKGFQLQKILEVFSLNVISRVIGMIFRLVTFCIGILAEITLIGTTLIVTTLWIIAPAVFFALFISIFAFL